MEIKVIAHIYNDFNEKFGIPRQSGRAPSVISRIKFCDQFNNPDALRGIQDFSHLWLIFDFSKAHKNEWSPLVRPPRLGGNTKVGVFASRSPFRPNNIGLSCVKLVDVIDTSNGKELIVSGADLLSGTPIYDIKPYVPFADCHPDAVGSFADEHQGDKLSVVFPDNLKTDIPNQTLNAIIECLEDDPRPSYQEDGRVYGMSYAKYNVKFTVNGNVLTVSDVETAQKN
jgi:tRNA-Thr(GGU) m(6)t(6)A37 methyltransferase TsaA